MARRRGGAARLRLTARGWGFAATSVLLFWLAYVGGREALLFAAALPALLLVGGLALLILRRVRVSAARTFSPSPVSAQRPAQVTVSVSNERYSRSGEAVWRDTLPWWPKATPDARLPPLAPRGRRFAGRGNTVRLDYPLRAPRRGVYRIGPLHVEQRDPFGLATLRSTAAGEDEIIVVPDAMELPRTGLSLATGEGSARVLQRDHRGTDDDIMTREYRPGDALRRVHWRVTARQGELMVRQEEQRSYPEARIVIDTRRGGYADAVHDQFTPHAGESEAFEWAVRMVASMGVHLHRRGFLVRILETAHPQIAELGDGNRWAGRDQEFLLSLASIGLVDADHRSPVPAQERSDRAAGPVFAVLAEPDDAVFEWLTRQKRPFELAVAFVLSTAPLVLQQLDREGQLAEPGHTVETLERLGWIAVPVSLADEPSDAWRAVVAETGLVHDEA